MSPLLRSNRYRPGQSIGFHTDRVEKLDDMVWSVVVDSGGPRDGLHFQFPLEKPAAEGAAPSSLSHASLSSSSSDASTAPPSDAAAKAPTERGQASGECRIGIVEKPGLVSVQTGCARSVLKHGVLSVERERISVTWRFFRPDYLRTTEGWFPAPQRLARFAHEVMIREQRYALERERGNRPPLPPRKAQTSTESAAEAAATASAIAAVATAAAAAASAAGASSITANSAAPVASAAAVLDADVAAVDALPAASSVPTPIPLATPPGHQGVMRSLLVGTERPAVATFSRAEGAALLADFRRLTEEAASAQHVNKDLPRLDQPPPGPPLPSHTGALPVATAARVESVHTAPNPPPSRPPLDTEALFKESATTSPLVGVSPLLPPALPRSQAGQLPPPVTVGVICSGMGGVVGRSSVDKWARVGAAAENALDSSDLTGLLCGALGEAFAKSAAADAVPGWPRGFRVCVCDLFAGDPKTMYLREGLRKFGGPPLAVLPVELPSAAATAPGSATHDASFGGPAAAPEMVCFGTAADLYVLLEGGFRAADVANSVLERGEAPLLRVACTGGAAAGWVGSLATQNLPIMLLDTTTGEEEDKNGDPTDHSAGLDSRRTDSSSSSSSDSSAQSSNSSNSYSSRSLRGSVGWSSGGSSEALLLTKSSSPGSAGVGEGTASTTACLTVAEQRELSLEKQAQEVARDLTLLRAARLARPEERAAVADAVVRLVRAHNTASLSRKRSLSQAAAVAAVGGLQSAPLNVGASNSAAGKGSKSESSNSSSSESQASLAPGAGTTRGELARPPQNSQRAWQQDWHQGGGAPIGASNGEYARASSSPNAQRQVQPPHHSSRPRGQHLASSSSFRVPPGRSSGGGGGLGPNPAEDAEVPPLGAMRALLLGSSSSRPAGATFSRAEGAALYSDWRRLRDAERAGGGSSALPHPQSGALGYQPAAPSSFFGSNGDHSSSSSSSSSTNGNSSGSYGDAAAWEGFDRMFFGNIAPSTHSAKMP